MITVFTAFTSTEAEKVKKGLRQKKDISTENKEELVSSNVNSKPDLELKTHKKPSDLSEYG